MTRAALRPKRLLVVTLVMAMLAMPARDTSGQSGLSSVKTVFVILFENTNWASITPSRAPYIRTVVVPMGAHAEQYFNPPRNHPSEPNYIWLEAGGNLGLTTNNDASASNSTSTVDHLVRYLESAGISWRSYQEDIDGTICPLTSEELTGGYMAKHNPFVFFRDLTTNNSPNSSYPAYSMSAPFSCTRSIHDAPVIFPELVR